MPTSPDLLAPPGAQAITPVTRRLFLRLAGLAAAAAACSRPVPAAAASAGSGFAASTESGFTVEIAPGVFAHKGHIALYAPNNGGDVSNAGFIVGREAVAVIDTGGSAQVGAQLHAAIRERTPLPIRYVINTHMHPDHVFGNAAFEADHPAFVAHHKMARGLAARAERYLAINREAMGEAAFEGTKIVMPTVPVSAPMRLDLGGREIVLEPQKTAHTDNDLVIRDPQTATAFLGDLLFVEHVPTLDGSIIGWQDVLGALAATPAQRVVPGHGPPSVPWPGAAEPIQRYLKVVTNEIRALLKENRTLSDATATVGLSEKDAWELFEDYHARNVSAAFAELEWE